jgi:hypothetical protein
VEVRLAVSNLAGSYAYFLASSVSAVTSLQLSDDLLISGSDDGEIRVWNFGPQTTSTGVAPTATGPTIPNVNASIMRSTN